jgi:PAS domain S-box-containing protein
MLGYSSFEELSTRNLEQDGFEPSYERKKFIEQIELHGEVTGLESAWNRQDGSVVYIRESARAIRDPNGTTLYYDGSVEDISERKRAEEELSRSEEKYRSIFENVQDVYYEVTFDGTILEISPSVEFISKGQYHRADLIGKSVFDIYADAKDHDKFITVLRKSGSVTDLEVQLKNRDGSLILCSFSAKIYYDAHGKPGKIIGSMHDITERKRAEEELSRSEEKYRSIFENVQDVYYETLFDGTIIEVSPSIEIISKGQYKRTDLIGKSMYEFYPDAGDRDMILAAMQKTKRLNDFEVQLKNRDGSLIPCSVSAKMIFNTEGRPVKITGSMHDISERKQAEDALRQMQKLEGIGTLAGGIAHDFNNILGIILAFNTNIVKFKDDSKMLDTSTKTIAKAVERGRTLVQQILTFARKTETSFGAVNVNDVVAEIMTMILETFPKILTFAQNFEKGIPFINSDRSQLHQALLNLCVNARDAMPSGGTLTINTRIVSSITLRSHHPDAAASSYVCIEVSDTGEGITPETQKRIFEPFFTTKEKGKGTGLGLAVVFGVVQTHKGFIDVNSELGKGTTFRLYLPVSQVPEPISVKEEETLEDIPGGTETLLVVEDEEMLMMSLKMVLGDKGYTVLSAKDGLTALKIYHERKEDIALVLTDLGLPNMSGM